MRVRGSLPVSCYFIAQEPVRFACLHAAVFRLILPRDQRLECAPHATVYFDSVGTVVTSRSTLAGDRSVSCIFNTRTP